MLATLIACATFGMLCIIVGIIGLIETRYKRTSLVLILSGALVLCMLTQLC